MSLEEFENKPRRTVLNWIISAIVVLAIAGVVGGVIRFVLYPAQQAGRVVERTLDADNVIYNYEWFKRQAQDIGAQATRANLAVEALSDFEESAGSRDTWRFEDRTEWSRLNTDIRGAKGQCASMVAAYNARAQMANRDIFRSRDLPAQFELPAACQ